MLLTRWLRNKFLENKRLAYKPLFLLTHRSKPTILSYMHRLLLKHMSKTGAVKEARLGVM